jgi:hypothetical protein
MKTPFTVEQFLEVFVNYNTTLFPVQILIFVLGLTALGLIHAKSPWKDRLIGGFLGLLWIWTGAVYHIAYFSAINKTAYAFGGIFILQGGYFLYETLIKKKYIIDFRSGFRVYSGYFFVLFGLIIYPVITYAAEPSAARVISLGLPCPSTILTFGFLMMADKHLSKYLLLIPSLWAVVGISAAINFGIYQDIMLIIAAVVADIFLIARTK